MNVGKKLGLGFGVVIALMLVTVYLGINRLNEINTQVDDMVNEHIAKKDMFGTWQQNIIENSANAVAALKTDDPHAISYYQELVNKNAGQAADIVKNLDNSLKNNPSVSDDIKAMYVDTLIKRNAYSSERKRLFDIKLADNNAELNNETSNLITIIGNYKDAVSKLSDVYSKKTQEDYVNIEHGYKLGYLILVLGGLISLIIGIVVAIILTRRIIKSIKAALWIAENVSQGNLAIEFNGTIPRDEIGALILALRRMKLSLRKAVYEIRQDAEKVNTSSSEIASGNLDLSSRTEEQASSLEETAASMEELTTTVKQNSDNAMQANQLSVKAVQTADNGGVLATQAIETMKKITDSSHKIAEIISVIDGIAFQTNILALNASVEAARAGEQGRGFAVVATEVRNLAQRSSAAAKEIKELIDYSVTTVDSGHTLVNNVGDSIQEIIAEIKRVADIVGEISAASKEQSAGIEQVNQAVMQLDQVTQQNAALVEQAAAASESMQEQSKHLVHVVDVFKMPENITIDSIETEQIQLKTISHQMHLDKNALLLEKD